LLVCLGAGEALPVAAQSSAPVLEEVVVTAQRREQRLQDVPIAVTAFDTQTMRINRITALEDIADRTPGFVMTSVNPAEPNFYIRGIGTEGLNADAGGNSSVVQFVDDVYIGRGGGSNFDLFDVERIEVLRGPQGTLFGKNAVGGLVHVISTRPTAERQARLEGSVGNYDRMEFRGLYTGPLTEDLFVKVALSSNERDGYVRNLTTGRRVFDQDSQGARIGLRYQPGDTLDVMLTLDGVRARTSGQPRSNLADPTVNGGIHAIGDPDPLVINAQEDGWNDRDIFGVTNRVDWEIPQGTLTSITAYREAEYNFRHGFFSVPVTATTIESTNHNIEDANQFSQELRLTNVALDGRLDWVLGLYYLREDVDRTEILIQEFAALAPILDGVARYDQNVTANSYAAFGQASYALSDALSLTVGGRVTWEDKDADVRGTIVEGGLPPPLQGDFDASADESWNAFTPRVAVDYHLSDDVMLYASAARGFKSGGFQGTPPDGNVAVVPYDEEFAWSYEVGAKTRLLQDQLQINVALFSIDHEDLQVSELVAGDRIVIGNAGEAEIDGAEIEFSFTPLEGLLFNGSYGYLDAEFVEFAEGATADHTGNTLPRAPEHKVNLGVSYQWALGRIGTASVRVDWTYQDDIFFEASNTPLEVQKAYDTWDARVAVESLNGEWELAVWGKNLSDELIKDHSVAFAPFGYELVSFAEPRTAGVTLTWSLQ
jgi:iron complex outermembrane receptor protein